MDLIAKPKLLWQNVKLQGWEIVRQGDGIFDLLQGALLVSTYHKKVELLKIKAVI